MTFLHPNPSAVYRHILSPFPINVKGYPSRSMASRDLAGQFGTRSFSSSKKFRTRTNLLVSSSPS